MSVLKFIFSLRPFRPLTEKEKFKRWHWYQRWFKGMKSFHSSVNPELLDPSYEGERPTEEELYGELNRMINSENLYDPRFDKL